MQVLVLCDDHDHPSSRVRSGLEALGDHEFHFDFIEDATEWSAERMRRYPVVLLAKSNHVSAADRSPWMTPEVEQAFFEYVLMGGGLLAVHSGTAGYRETPGLRRLLGGVFDHHPKQCPVTFQPAEGHSLAVGCEPFTVVDEHYFMTVDDPNVDVFATTTSKNGAQPGAWTRSVWLGRVCVLTPGHNPEVWLQPGFQAVLRNALRWCRTYHPIPRR
ncbi:MAG: ThuA domain-containing protein [Anaerolineae bacterium]|nr:ThuA domain-containing protein [Anaerolineae bacterium]